MSYPHFLRFAALTVLVCSIHTTVLHAQRVRNSILYDATEGPGGKMTGTLTDGSGPVKGVLVSLISNGNVVLTTTTGDNGTYTFPELMPGIYDISCRKDGYRKLVINEIPVVETYLTNNDLTLSKAMTSKEERTPVMKYYDKLENNKLVKM